MGVNLRNTLSIRKISIIDARLYLVSILVGVATALINIPYHELIVGSYNLRSWFVKQHFAWYLYVGVFAAAYGVLILIMYMVRRYPILSGGGVPQARAVLNGRITFHHDIRNLFFKFFGGIASLGMGLSMGREGPSIHFGSYMGDYLSKKLKVRVGLRKHLVAAGVGAGLASAFSAPLAGAIIVIESVERFDAPKTAVTSFLAACIAGYMSNGVFAQDVLANIKVVPPTFSYWLTLVMFAAVAAAVVLYGKLFVSILLAAKRMYPKFRLAWPLKMLVLLIVAFAVSFWMVELTEGGEHFLVSEALGGTSAIGYLAVLILVHFLFTAISFAPGLPGGIFIPLLVAGGVFGKLLGLVMASWGIIQPENVNFFILVTMSAFLVSIYRTPITSIVLVMEISGHFDVFFPTVIVGGLTYYFSELLHMRAIDKVLYDQMVALPQFQSQKRVSVYLEVMARSYLEGRNTGKLQLPAGCVIKSIRRNADAISTQDQTLQAGDQLEVEINSSDIETLYEPLVSMADAV